MPFIYADMAELADAQDLGSCGAIHAGSIPVIRTKKKRQFPTEYCRFFLYFSLFILHYSQKENCRFRIIDKK